MKENRSFLKGVELSCLLVMCYYNMIK